MVALGGATASAGARRVPRGVAHVRGVETSISHDGSVPLGGGKFLISGHLDSHRGVCEHYRLVKLVAHYPSGRTRVLDFDLTSFEGGAWAMRANLTGADRLKAKVLREAIAVERQIATGGRSPSAKDRPRAVRSHKVVCGAAAVVWGAP